MKESSMKKLRLLKGIRLIDLAEMTGVSHGWLWFLENGYEKGISWKVKSKVACALGTTTENLFKPPSAKDSK